MRITPIVCECKSCECAIYTYEDSKICKECSYDNHLSGAKKKDYAKTEEKPQSS